MFILEALKSCQLGRFRRILHLIKSSFLIWVTGQSLSPSPPHSFTQNLFYWTDALGTYQWSSYSN